MKNKPYIDSYKEFKNEFSIFKSKYIMRKFNYDTNEKDLIWHRDKKDRIVYVLKSNNWLFQLDEMFPSVLKENTFLIIPKDKFHRIHKGIDDLLLLIIEEG